MLVTSLENEKDIINILLPAIKLSAANQEAVINSAQQLISTIRQDHEFGIEEFIQQFSLSTAEGVAIMCLAEGLLRIPDKEIAAALVIDKLADKNWQLHLNKSKSVKAGFVAYGLYISGKLADMASINNVLTNMVNNISQPVFLTILKRAIEFLGKEFIFGHDVPLALASIKNYPNNRFAFDLLGESAHTLEQAEEYYNQYLTAIEQIAASNSFNPNVDLWHQPNLSVKLTALYPRFEFSKKHDIDNYLLPKLITLVKKVRDNNLTITFDAEEAKRLDIYLYTILQIINDHSFKNFNGIGLVLQAYQTRAYKVLDEIIAVAKTQDRQIPIRLVKGAYWDLEIKQAQEQGLKFYPVFTKKEYTDASYIACAKKMLEHGQYIFPQFATHNALTAATIIELAQGQAFEFQKLHGMGKALHNTLNKNHPVRIYAPIGKMNDLLAYLMRRMLENGANSCFVNQVKNAATPSAKLAYNLYEHVKHLHNTDDQPIILPKDIYPNRENPIGYELGYQADYHNIYQAVSGFYGQEHQVSSIIDGKILTSATVTTRSTPAKSLKKFVDISRATTTEISMVALSAANGFNQWSKYDIKLRADILRKIADLYEENKFYLYALLIEEAGKTIKDAIAEVVEAIDFCRYYANQAEILFSGLTLPSPTGESNMLTLHPRGIFLCISPWNFPLAIFTGQIAAALVTGNSVIAKPAEQTPVIASIAVKLMHQAGVPTSALHLIIASGSDISKYIISDERISGVVFTGSTATARIINLNLAARTNGIVPFIAETGGQNAMIVDSSALLEQVTDDVLNSAFGSSGQRCSALRIIYIQDEIYEPLLKMIKDAMAMLTIADPSNFATDIGPVIDKQSLLALNEHVKNMIDKGFNLVAHHPQVGQQQDGYFFYPHIIEITSINDIPEEKFGSILHVVRYKANELDAVLDEINACGFGLTFGIHSRIERKIEYICTKIRVGNIYANRSIIGAKVESQPFGGENKSGTGFKAGGPHYLLRFITERTITINLTAVGGNIELLNKN
ncbi:bifunctional proline dehydrogenase/L-glutamate gamma-semialdehyde dehydrogenase PutA [Candidatus Trichorickettsia mobilis]|uniref:bifunctional proline dehydrogenase/L-glutamate gamma-semialdehyde dehydrogenase PutA n=1 Tax=Candidatus Trichorickettsia mobilis TaxID=1346319 RepID=UPI00293020A8|nr:bifunctional proline dehydrogenase/L-glutamate gamma-semialdehyde dehydrogenase PutA [Candidatus Trichorickettsia mobilis]